MRDSALDLCIFPHWWSEYLSDVTPEKYTYINTVVFYMISVWLAGIDRFLVTVCVKKLSRYARYFIND